MYCPRMSRTSLAVVLALLAAPRVAAAQSMEEGAPAPSPLTGGVQAGVAASSWIGTPHDSTHLGATLGGFARYRLAPMPMLSLQVELAMIDKGADFDAVAGTKADEALIYLELPILARIDLDLTPSLALHGVAGPGVALLVD